MGLKSFIKKAKATIAKIKKVTPWYDLGEPTVNETPIRPRFERRFIGKNVTEVDFFGTGKTSISTLANVSAVLSFESRIKPTYRSKDPRYSNYGFLKNEKAVGGLVKHNKGKFKLSDEFQIYVCNEITHIKLL